MALVDEDVDGRDASGESKGMAISNVKDCEPMRRARIARGSEANPSRRATSGDWSTYECCVNKNIQGVVWALSGKILPCVRPDGRLHFHVRGHDIAHLCTSRRLTAECG